MSMILFPTTRFYQPTRRYVPERELFGLVNALERQLERELEESVDKIETVRPNHETVALTESGYNVDLDVSAYKPEELKIRLEERQLIVEGEHNEENEQGSLRRSFHRRFRVPEVVNLEGIKSSLSPNGRLQIEAPLVQKAIDNGRSIPIEIAKSTEKAPAKP